MLDPQFDAHASEYEDQCMRGVGLSGESKEFFARGRVGSLLDWWKRTGRATPHSIVDYGCGIGHVSPILAEAFPESRVVGVDPSGDCVERARKSHSSDRVRFVTADEFAGGIEGSTDLVHVSGVLHHIQPENRHGFFETVAALLAPEGVLALFENNPLNPGTRLVMSRIPFDRDAVPVMPREAQRLLRGAHLADVSTRFLSYFPRPLRALRPLERFLLRVPLGAQYAVFAVRADSPAAARAT